MTLAPESDASEEKWLRWHASEAAALRLILCAIGGYYSARSLWLGLTLANPMPYLDQWIFIVLDYFRYQDGEYSWLDLFAANNEHRIATTRLVLFADAILFQMRGVLPVVINYACLAAIAAIIARLMTGRMGWADRAPAFLLTLAILWSLCEWINLSWQFQVQFALAHLFVLLCLTFLAAAAIADTRGITYGWIAAAMAADFLAVFSLGSGLFTIIPALALTAWLRAPRILLAFTVGHFGLMALYFIDYAGVPFLRYGFAGLRSAELIVLFPSQPVVFGTFAVVVGTAGLALATLLASHLTHLSLRKRPPAAICVLAALAGFVVLEAAIVAYTRPDYGVNGRYATAAVVFWSALLGALWAIARRHASRTGEALTVAAAVAITMAANDPRFETYWRTHVAFLDRVTHEVQAGEFREASIKQLFPGDWMSQAMRKLQAAQLGPFAPNNTLAVPRLPQPR
jgi:hypothetical protein